MRPGVFGRLGLGAFPQHDSHRRESYVYTGIVSFILLKILDSVMGLRVDEDEEAEGLDVALQVL